MSPDDLVHYASQALIVCLLVSAPAVVSGALVESVLESLPQAARKAARAAEPPTAASS